MSDRTPPRRRRIAGESPVTPPATKKATGKPVVKKPAPAPRGRAADPAAPASGSATSSAKAPSAKTPTAKAPVAKAPVAKASAAAPRTSVAGAVERRRADAGSPRVATATPRSGGSGGASPRDVLVLVLAAVLLVGGATTAVLGFRHWQGESFSSSQAEATKVATSSLEKILSYRYDQLDEHETQARELMTAKYFADEYEKVTAPALEELAPQRKIQLQAVVRNAGLVPCGDSCSVDKASVLMFVDVDSRTEGGDEATVYGNRVVVDVVRQDGDWLVSNIRGL